MAEIEAWEPKAYPEGAEVAACGGFIYRRTAYQFQDRNSNTYAPSGGGAGGWQLVGSVADRERIAELEAESAELRAKYERLRASVSVAFGCLHNINANANSIVRWIGKKNSTPKKWAEQIISARHEAHLALVDGTSSDT